MEHMTNDLDRVKRLQERVLRLAHEIAHGTPRERAAARNALEVVVPDLCDAIADVRGEPVPAGFDGETYTIELPRDDEALLP
jgi:hypothetical protein